MFVIRRITNNFTFAIHARELSTGNRENEHFLELSRKFYDTWRPDGLLGNEHRVIADVLVDFEFRHKKATEDDAIKR